MLTLVFLLYWLLLESGDFYFIRKHRKYFDADLCK